MDALWLVGWNNILINIIVSMAWAWNVLGFWLVDRNITLVRIRIVVLIWVDGLLILIWILVGISFVWIDIRIKVRVNIRVRVFHFLFHLLGELLFHISKVFFFWLDFRHCIVILSEFVTNSIDFFKGYSIPF